MQRISTRLAISFLLVALLPALPLSLVVTELLERRFGDAVAEPLDRALEAGLDESRAGLTARREALAAEARFLARRTWGIDAILLDDFGRVQDEAALQRYLVANIGLPAEGPQAVRRFGQTLVVGFVDPSGRPVKLIQPLPEGMVSRAGTLTEGVTLLRTMRAEEGRVMRSFLGPFLLIYGVLILVALWAGFLWSRRMVRPLETLVRATRQVASGDLDFRLQKQGPGEVGELVESFDTMIRRLGEQRRDLARLERASAWRGMARTLAHEVKNPLTPILMAVHQVRDGYPGEDPNYRAVLEEVAQIVGEEVDSLRRLVHEFGDFARLPKCHLEPVVIAPLLRDLEKLYSSENVRLEMRDLPGTVNVDAAALRRALVNLIDNGLAACREVGREPEVQIRAWGERKAWCMDIQDQGVGISEDNLARLFEPDFTTKSGGMGLGLAIVENIVLGHGGSIDVDSTPGEGTTFQVRLPLASSGEKDAEE